VGGIDTHTHLPLCGERPFFPNKKGGIGLSQQVAVLNRPLGSPQKKSPPFGPGKKRGFPGFGSTRGFSVGRLYPGAFFLGVSRGFPRGAPKGGIPPLFPGRVFFGPSNLREKKGGIFLPKVILGGELVSGKLLVLWPSLNGETVYLRNRVRHILVPALKGVFPGYKKALLSFRKKMEMTGEYLKCSMGDLLGLPDEDGNLNIDAVSFGKLLPMERMELLYSGWEKWRDKPCRTLRFRTISSVISGKYDHFSSGNRTLISAGDFMLVQTGGMILWKRLVVNAKKSYLE